MQVVESTDLTKKRNGAALSIVGGGQKQGAILTGNERFA